MSKSVIVIDDEDTVRLFSEILDEHEINVIGMDLMEYLQLNYSKKPSLMLF